MWQIEQFLLNVCDQFVLDEVEIEAADARDSVCRLVCVVVVRIDWLKALVVFALIQKLVKVKVNYHKLFLEA